MKKVIKNIVIGATCCTLALAVTAGCGPDVEHADRESRPVALAIGAVEENFNPFFYSSQNDGEIVNMTQIAMLNADTQGNIVCGEDQATMALDYTVKTYDSNNNEIDGGNVDYTVYEFLIKNGVKDSMGYDMGIKDVLFNLYVYLDPLYTGSSTIYSTKIKGLARYRSQQINMDDDADDNILEDNRAAAQIRVNRILSYDSTDNPEGVGFNAVKDDIQTVAEKFKEELNSDWIAVEGTVNSSADEYRFTEDWQLYLFQEGMVEYQYRRNSAGNLERVKDENGKYYTTLDPAQPNVTGYDSRDYAKEISDAVTAGKTVKDTSIGIVFDSYFDEIETGVYDGFGQGQLTEILTQRSTGNEVMRQFINDEISKGSSSVDGELRVKEISGIQTRETSEFNGKTYDEQHDVLSITISGVDPVAIYNFAFTVAPMHYYSGTVDGYNCIEHANEYKDTTKSNRFGVLWANEKFMNDVVGASSKRAAPVGAGAYKIKTGNIRIYNNGLAEYERNENFTTLGSGLSNAKIKYLNYVYTPDDGLINALKTSTVDYATPNCTPDNIREVTGVSHLNSRNFTANGFGYVGINPTYVPDREVRLAIMLAMNPNEFIITNYYTPTYSEPLYRPSSRVNFLYNYSQYSDRLNNPYVATVGATQYPIRNTADPTVIENLLRAGGWVTKNGDGIYTKNGKTLSLTFTIAGNTQDHPAWQMFIDARDFLNEIGFDITVKTDRNALQMLATGKLAVWAAAWSTGIDPDMYQIYHKDSTASNTKNWGYDTILNNSDLYSEENAILTALSSEIDEARSTTNEQTRTLHYVNALDNVMELAVELPTYQRHDLAVYNKRIINPNSLNQNPTANAGLLFKIWELDYN